jgi:oxygen-independent coproporphyrinogen-3 oxidase
VNRVQAPQQVRRLADQAREIGYTSINYDLIYGLPLQTRKSIQDTIEIVRDHRPERIAFYGYAHVPWIKPSQRQFTDDDIPLGNVRLGLYEMGRSMIEEAGYREIGMDQFVLESDPLWIAAKSRTLHRNFMGYTSQKVSPLIGLGVSAIGDSWTAFSQNEKLIESYQTRIEKKEIPILRGHLLTSEDQLIRKHILNLTTQMYSPWSQDFDWIQDNPIYQKLIELSNDGLILLSQEECRVTERGRPFLKNICMAFDIYLNPGTSVRPLFSRTV